MNSRKKKDSLEVYSAEASTHKSRTVQIHSNNQIGGSQSKNIYHGRIIAQSENTKTLRTDVGGKLNDLNIFTSCFRCSTVLQ